MNNQQTATATTGVHPATAEDVNRTNNMIQTSYPLAGGNNMEDMNRTSNMTQTSHPLAGGHNNNTSLWMKKPENVNNNKDSLSAVSSTPSEYGSSDESHRSPHVSNASRPVADKNAFIQNDETNKYWQNTMTPAQRAKELAAEMGHTICERRKSSADADKTLKIGGKKEIKLE